MKPPTVQKLVAGLEQTVLDYDVELIENAKSGFGSSRKKNSLKFVELENGAILKSKPSS